MPIKNSEMINIKAIFTLRSVIRFTKLIRDGLVDDIPDLRTIGDEEKGMLNDVLVVFVLYHTETFYSEIIGNKRERGRFQSLLYRHFQELLQHNPKPLKEEMIKYIQEVDNGEYMFLGSRLCKDILGVEDFTVLMASVAVIKGYIPMMLRACAYLWNLDEQECEMVRLDKEVRYLRKEYDVLYKGPIVKQGLIAWWKKMTSPLPK